MHKEKENLYQSNAVSRLVGILEDLGQSIVAPILQHFEVHHSIDQMGVGPVIKKLLWSIPNNKTLKELLVCSTQWVQLCLEKGK